MINIKPEFRSENLNRAYPIEEDASWDVTNSSILDIRGWTRLAPIDPVIHSISRWDDIGDTTPSVLTDLAGLLEAGYIQIFFEVFNKTDLADRVIVVNIPSNTTDWPATVSGSVTNEAGIMTGYISVTVGESILDDVPNSNVVSGVAIEPTLIVPIGGQVVDEFRVIHQDSSPDQYLKGNLTFLQGINSRSTQRGSIIEFFAEKYAGLGNQIYDGNDRGKCRGVLSVNASSPGNNGKFTIKGSNGVVVTDYPDEHRIDIGVIADTKLVGCEDVD